MRARFVILGFVAITLVTFAFASMTTAGVALVSVATPTVTTVTIPSNLHAPYAVCNGGDGYSYVQCSASYSATGHDTPYYPH